jgi:hypothetical protein
MIRRDYFIRMIQEFAERLARIRALTAQREYGEAAILTEQEFQRITGLDSATLLKLSETELLARLIESDSPHAVRGPGACGSGRLLCNARAFGAWLTGIRAGNGSIISMVMRSPAR